MNEGPAGKTFGLSVIAELVQYFITASQIFPLIPFPWGNKCIVIKHVIFNVKKYMKVRMSKMDSLLIYTQRREKRTVTMKLRSCDLSIIFSWQPHIQLPGCSQNPPPPNQLGSLSNLRRFDAVIPLFDELRPRKPHWGSGRSIYGCDEHTVKRRVFNMTVLFLIFMHTSTQV